MASDIRLQPKKVIKNYHYSCNWCWFSIDDDKERMVQHCLKSHGVTGKFKPGYKVTVRRKFKG